ncbi:MAG: tetratricopeptide repeat protein [Candidatus Eisenbacteria bacterium]|uniref:Tetratricopeptide repeat protein n=1 Tax=Eiseniibacteriota bacterium TaxID=2212470 RepID=A0A937X9C8_UNCEI|nr:tetratricopeptide repeat protein [Candidatus Eisenbacteria bacterium]
MRSRWIVLTCGIALALPGALAGCGKSEFLAGGKLHFTQGRPERALELFEKAVAEQPRNAEAHLWYARALAELERDEEAAAELKTTVELDALQQEMVDNTLLSYWSRRYNSALTFVQAGENARAEGDEALAVQQLERAEDRLRRAAVFTPDSVQNFSNLGKVLFQLGRRDEAMDYFKQAKQMSAGKPRLQAFLFTLFKHLGEQALQSNERASIERALVLMHDAEGLPAEPGPMLELHFNLGSAYYALSELDTLRTADHLVRAAEYYDKVLAQDPGDVMALENLAYVYSEQGRHEEALAVGQKRLDLEPWSEETHLLMVRLHTAAKNNRPANAHLLFSQMLRQGVRLPLDSIRADAGKWGPSADALKMLRDRGAPEERRSYTVGMTAHECWYYWTEGRVYFFQEGQEEFRIAFQGISREKLAELLAG